MSHIRTLYELRRFTSGTDPDFHLALQLYARLIPGSVRTQSNEISYWLESYRAFSPDQLVVCGFYSDNAIIGYAELVYFHQERTVAVDYMLLHEAHRESGQYFQFARMLKHWVDQQNWEIDYTVAEVALELAPHEPYRQPPLIELFKQMGFAVADCPYFQPQLGLGNEQSDIRAHFLVRPSEPMPFLSAPVFIKLVQTVYFKHYKRWYEPFIDTMEPYEKLLQARFSEIKAAAQKAVSIELDGVKDIIPRQIAPAPSRSRRNNQLISSAGAALLVLTVCFCLLLFQRIFSSDTATVLSCLSASLFVSFATFALFYQKGQAIFTQLLRAKGASDKKRLR